MFMIKYKTAKPLARQLQCGNDILLNVVRVACFTQRNTGVNIATGFRDATTDSICLCVYTVPNYECVI
jgi:hypothetical protein